LLIIPGVNQLGVKELRKKRKMIGKKERGTG
jgi:hypothetical protein